MTIQDEAYLENLRVVYHGGLRYPHLMRVAESAALDSILAPHGTGH
jgi:hypothetical protein